MEKTPKPQNPKTPSHLFFIKRKIQKYQSLTIFFSDISLFYRQFWLFNSLEFFDVLFKGHRERVFHRVFRGYEELILEIGMKSRAHICRSYFALDYQGRSDLFVLNFVDQHCLIIFLLLFAPLQVHLLELLASLIQLLCRTIQLLQLNLT